MAASPGRGRLTESATHRSSQFAYEPPQSAHRSRAYKVRASQGKQEHYDLVLTISRKISILYCAVYAPDYIDEGALRVERRLKVREQHLANAHKESRMSTLLAFRQSHERKVLSLTESGGMVFSPNEELDMPDAEKKIVGSLMIFEASSYAAVISVGAALILRMCSARWA